MIAIISFLLLSLSTSLAAPSKSKECSFSEGNYHLEWSADDKGDINFQLELIDFPTGGVWTGVAFGETMVGSRLSPNKPSRGGIGRDGVQESGLDAIIVKSLKGQLSITDEYVKGYGPSKVDAQQNVRTEQLTLVDGKLQAQFSRPSKASEKQVDHDLNGCTTWQFVTGLGEVHSDHVGKHSKTPTHRRVCLEKCKK